MASTSHAFLGFLFILLISQSMNVLAGRDIKVADDKKEPEFFGHFDGTVLVPGFGRYFVPKKDKHFNPFTYNPITGTDGGNGLAIPGTDGGTNGGSTGRSYIPGGDDTFIPNPGFEVPNPAGGSIPTPSQP